MLVRITARCGEGDGRIAVDVGVQHTLDLLERESKALQRDQVLQASDGLARVAAMPPSVREDGESGPSRS
jgi:hypothetical protein